MKVPSVVLVRVSLLSRITKPHPLFLKPLNSMIVCKVAAVDKRQQFCSIPTNHSLALAMKRKKEHTSVKQSQYVYHSQQNSRVTVSRFSSGPRH